MIDPDRILYIGIDPGQSGAIAYYENYSAKPIKIIKMPTALKEVAFGKYAHKAKGVSAKKISEFFYKSMANKICAVVEKPFTLPTQGHVSNFSIGWNAAQVYAALDHMNSVSVKTIAARTWQKAVGQNKIINSKDSKERSFALCEQLYPEVNLIPDGCRTKHDGFADALLLLHYCMNHQGWETNDG